MDAEEKAVEAVREAIRGARLDELGRIKNLISLHRLEHDDTAAEKPLTRALWEYLLAREREVRNA